MNSNSQIKVLQIITLFSIGGATETVISIASGLQKKGYSVDIITGPDQSCEGSLLEEAKKNSLNVKVIKQLIRGINPFYDFFTLLKLVYVIKKNGYKIVHTHSSKAGILGRWAANIAGVKIIIHTIHGWSFNDFQFSFFKKLLILIEKITAKKTSKLVVVTQNDILKGMKNKIGNEDDYIVIRSGIDLHKFSTKQIHKTIYLDKLKIPEGSFVIGSVTRFSPQKAPLDTILAFYEVSRTIENAVLLMVGDGSLFSDANKLVTKLKITNKVIFTGMRRDIPQLFNVIDIFVLSSLWEGLPRVILQSLASGVPVIATNIDGNAEIIKNEVNGVLVPPNQPLLLARAILKFHNESEKKNTFILNSNEILLEYSEQKMVEDIDKLYQSFITSI